MKTQNRIPSKVKKQYEIRNTQNELTISKPCYINVDKDCFFNIERSESCIRIKNSKVNISLWIDILNMHVTVYR